LEYALCSNGSTLAAQLSANKERRRLRLALLIHLKRFVNCSCYVGKVATTISSEGGVISLDLGSIDFSTFVSCHLQNIGIHVRNPYFIYGA
jgi:hypothetical protein